MFASDPANEPTTYARLPHFPSVYDQVDFRSVEAATCVKVEVDLKTCLISRACDTRWWRDEPLSENPDVDLLDDRHQSHIGHDDRA